MPELALVALAERAATGSNTGGRRILLTAARPCLCEHPGYLHIGTTGRCLVCSALETGVSAGCASYIASEIDAPPCVVIPRLSSLARDLAQHGHAKCPFVWDRSGDADAAAGRARARLYRAARSIGVHVTTVAGQQTMHATVVR